MQKHVMTSPLRPTKCPCCGLTSDLATGEGRPGPGSYLICIGCAGVSRINLDWTQSSIPEAEVAKEPELWRVVTVLRAKLCVLKESKAEACDASKQ